MTTSEPQTIKLRPGQRLVHGKVWTFDMGMVNLDIAKEAWANVPDDLSSLSDEALRALIQPAVWIDNSLCGYAEWIERPGVKLQHEFRRRGLDPNGREVAA